MTKRELERFEKFCSMNRKRTVTDYGLTVITYEGELYSPKVRMEYQMLGNLKSNQKLPVRKKYWELFKFKNGPTIFDLNGCILGINHRFIRRVDLWIKHEGSIVKYF